MIYSSLFRPIELIVLSYCVEMFGADLLLFGVFTTVRLSGGLHSTGIVNRRCSACRHFDVTRCNGASSASRTHAPSATKQRNRFIYLRRV